MTTTMTTCTVNSRQHCSGGSVQVGRRGYPIPKISFIDSKSIFAEHCGEFEASHKVITINRILALTNTEYMLYIGTYTCLCFHWLFI